MFNSKNILAGFIMLLLLVPFSTINGAEHPLMHVHFIDVGQGDSILIQTPTGKNILVDGGPPDAGEKVVAYLKKNHIEKLDLLIATHPDIDHIGGIPHVIRAIKIDQIIDSGKYYTTKTYSKYINQIHLENIPILSAKENQRFYIDPLLSVEVLNTYDRGKSNNQSSIVLKITFNEMSFLLMGDVEKAQEKELLKKYDVNANFVKIAHHGSRTSSSMEFLQAVSPEVAFITYGRGNDFGHPVQRIIKNIDQLNVNIYSTAVYGDIVIRTDGTSYFILPEKSPIDGLLESS